MNCSKRKNKKIEKEKQKYDNYLTFKSLKVLGFGFAFLSRFFFHLFIYLFSLMLLYVSLYSLAIYC